MQITHVTHPPSARDQHRQHQHRQPLPAEIASRQRMANTPQTPEEIQLPNKPSNQLKTRKRRQPTSRVAQRQLTVDLPLQICFS